jgi:hypothetical protein
MILIFLSEIEDPKFELLKNRNKIIGFAPYKDTKTSEI